MPPSLSTAPSHDAPARRWGAAAACSAALLVLPLALWLALPTAVPPRSRAPAARATGPGVTAQPQAALPARAGSAEPGRAGEGGLEGAVEDPEGQPVAGASVSCTLGERELAAESDEAGHFHLGAEAAGCRAVARKPGFASSAEEELRAGSPLRLRLLPPTGISGNVVDEAGAPVMTFGLGVASFTPPGGDAGAPGTLQRAIDDAEGAFELTDLAPGRYELVVGPAVGAITTSEPIEVTRGSMVRGVRLALRPGVTVTGLVVDAVTHAPLEGARAYVLIGKISTVQPRTQGGVFTIEGAPAGRFDLFVGCAGYMPKLTRGLEGRPGGPALRVEVALDRPGAR